MARKDAKIQVALEFQANNASLSKATRGISNELNTLQRKTATVASSMSSFVPAFAAVGAGAFSAFTFAGRAAVQFQDAFAGVRKTLNFTGTAAKDQEGNFRALAKGLVDISKATPMAATELAKIGEIGGQLGISAGSIEKFTKTISQLTVATTMSAEEAAFALSRLAAITRLPERNLNNLASVLVRLGNEFAATESEIVGTAMKIASALELLESSTSNSAADSLALAAALKQVGQQTQAGSTAVARSLDIMATAVLQGGRELSIFAKVAGMTSTSFKALAEASPANAFVAFLEGLQAVGNAGGDTVQLLDELGLGQQRTLRALRSMALASADVKLALSSANEEFALNNALQTEAEKRYETVVSQLGILRNNIQAIGITTGDALLEPLNELIDMFRTIAGGTTADDLANIGKALAGVAIGINAITTARSKMNQLNALAMEAGMRGTGVDGQIRMFGDVGKGFGERRNLMRAQSLQAAGGETVEFNRKNFLAQQASLGIGTAGLSNILNQSEMMGIDIFDQKANQDLVKKFGTEQDMFAADVDDESLGLSTKEKQRLQILQAINEEQSKFIASNEKIGSNTDKILAKEEKLVAAKEKQVDAQEKLNRAKANEKSNVISLDAKDVNRMTEARVSAFDRADDIAFTLHDTDDKATIDAFQSVKQEVVFLDAAEQKLIATKDKLSATQKDQAKITDTTSNKFKELQKEIDDLIRAEKKLVNEIETLDVKLKDSVQELRETGIAGEKLADTLKKVATATKSVGTTPNFDKLKLDAKEADKEVKRLEGSIKRLRGQNRKMMDEQNKGRFMTTVKGRGGIALDNFGNNARSLRQATLALANYGNKGKEVNSMLIAMGKLLIRKRKNLLAAAQASQAAAGGTTAFRVAVQGLSNALVGAKAALASFLKMAASMVAFTAIMAFFTKLAENAKKTARAVEEVGAAVKGIIDIQSELEFQNIQLDMLNKALEEEMKKNSPDKNLLQTYRTQIDNLTKGINGANAQVEESIAALGENLLLGTTEQGVNVEARIDAISKAIGTTFDKDEFFAEVGKNIMDFENLTATSLLTGLQNLQETREELDALRASGGDKDRILALEQELKVFEALDNIAQNTNIENFVDEVGALFRGGIQDSFTGSQINSLVDAASLDDNLAAGMNLTFETMKDGSIAIFKEVEEAYGSMYGIVTETTREPLHIFDENIFAGMNTTEVNAVLDDLTKYILLADTLRQQATGKDAEKAMASNSTVIKMQNEALVQQAKFLKANGIILQDVDPHKDRQRAIKEVTQGTALFQQQQLSLAQQSAAQLGILEFQMSKFEKELNKSLEKAASGVSNVFSAMPKTIKKGVAAMVEEMVIKEARLKNFENNVKRLATIAPMTAKQMADQGIAAARQVEQLLKDPVAAFAIEASLSRMTPFAAEELGISEEEIERMQTAGLRLGDSASEGIIVGLQQRAPQLESTLVSMLDNAVEASQYFIKSKSPSLLTKQLLGEPMIDGVIVGIKEGSDELVSTLEGVVGEAIEATVELMTELESVTELQEAAQIMFAVTGGARALTAANYAVQKSEQALMATRRKNATLNERILKNQIALQKAELEGRANNITMSEQASVLQKRIALEEMQRKAKGEFSASERKAIADAEKQLEELSLAAEAGIVDALDVEVAEERLAELKGTNKSLDEQRLAILELAMAEEDLDETNRKIREVDEDLIRLREENVNLLDEQANASFELQTAFDNLEASQEAVVTQELAYSKAREEFIQFVDAAPELFDALIAGYGGVGSVVDATRNKVLMLTSSVETGADKAIQKLIDVVTQANMTASHLNSIDLLTNTIFDPTGTSAGAKQANTRATAKDFIKFLGPNNPLGSLLTNIGTTGSAIEAGKVDASSSDVFSSTEDFLRAEAALRRIDDGKQISFRDFANAIAGFLGINTKLDTAGNITFSEAGLSQFLSAENIKKVSAGAHTAGDAGFGTAVLGGTDTDLMNVGGGDLAEGGNQTMIHDYTREIPGRNQRPYSLRSGADIAALIRNATGTVLGTKDKSSFEHALEILQMPGKGVDPNSDQELAYQKDRSKTHYANMLYTKITNLLNTLGDERFDYLLKRKHGGVVKTFQRALVGEYGPEMVTAMPGGGLRVTPQGSERGGNINVENVNVNVTGVPTDPVQARKAAVQIQKALVRLDKEGTTGTGLSRR